MNDTNLIKFAENSIRTPSITGHEKSIINKFAWNCENWIMTGFL